MNVDINGFGKATQDMIDRFEHHIGFSLPEDYKAFLRQYNGGLTSVRYCNFFVNELNEEIPLNVLYGLGVDYEQADLQVWYDEYKDDLLPNSLIIGNDPGSGMIVLVNDLEGSGVYYWDHSWYFEQSDEEQNSYKIADSFQSFLDGLKKP
ncbi:SMI1/KNR4 family protein [Hazenella coriacea]|uniref:SUKH superfamily protein n=1 Tax=Hazenella coriacea TaxID=1179467 RepID=A0A4R3LBG0_9BACL|nr:SMI1/KNR4 family protein [Hazenella coriacea]TCS96550.1 SUKH superfamily protein [Hazenella coriacea]